MKQSHLSAHASSPVTPSCADLVGHAARALGVVALSFCLGSGIALAKGGGGTAKPVKPGTPAPAPTVTIPPPPAITGVTFTNIATTAGFDFTGFVQSATTNNTSCPELGADAVKQWGGSVVVNGRTILVPCNTIVQFPANTMGWEELFEEISGAPLALDGSAPTASTASFTYPSTEISVSGNIVNGQSIAGLITLSQQSLNSGIGYITRINYNDGSIYVGDAPGGADQVRIQINDPNGRFGRTTVLDARFSVDDENPTITGGSGFPMCVPRATPAATGAPETDLLCPQINRPKVNLSALSGGCRNFATAGVISPAGWELSPPTATQIYCSSFVMEAPGAANKPDSRQQAPFEVGDFIEYSGTLMKGSGQGPNGSDTFAAHTIHANVGIFTQPGTLPVYISIEESIIGTDAVPVAGQAPGLPALEGQDRFVIVGTTTDVTTPVDVYLIDMNPLPGPDSGKESHRWITTEGMTGGLAPGSAPFGGGIMTQLTGPQPGRFRLRANKPPAGILVSPTRNVRVVARTLCAPGAVTGATPATTFYDINGLAPQVATPANKVACLTRSEVANGLFAGQYLAPVSEYIFPENVVSGDRPVPYNFWALGFLVNGEGPGTGPLKPKPW